MPTRKSFKKYFLLAFVSIGLTLIVLGIYFVGYERTVLSFDTTPAIVRTQAYVDSEPARIVIPALHIDTSITEGKIVHNVWQIASKGASHLNTSAIPGDKGNIIVYGHNLKVIFGSLPYIDLGDKIDVISKDDMTHSYVVVKTETVRPNDTFYIAPKNYEVLTVYTCNGFLDSTRFMVQAIPIKGY